MLEGERKRRKNKKKGGGGGKAGRGVVMEFALVCAGNLPILPRCHR